jgi:hypothetical protein
MSMRSPFEIYNAAINRASLRASGNRRERI